MTGGQEQLFELLALHSTQGLSSAESRRADELLKRFPDVELDMFDRAAAAVHLALLGPERPLPAHLRPELIAAGQAYFADRLEGRSDRADRSAAQSNLGWWVAAAALVLAISGWWPRLQGPPEALTSRAASVESLAAESGTVQLAWSATEDETATAASGELVWSTDRQAGFMVLSGLAVNDPSRYQYQLWIFDRSRDERYPVDGGVFDVTESGEVVIPIEARVPIEDPYLFAVTVEPPGGVVVSSRDRIALVAQPSA